MIQEPEEMAVSMRAESDLPPSGSSGSADKAENNSAPLPEFTLPEPVFPPPPPDNEGDIVTTI